MDIVLLKAKDTKTNIIQQQKHIFRYAHQNNIAINSTEIDNSNISDKFDSRNELKGFLRSLDNNDNILIYSLSTFSSNVEELIKIFNCLFERSIVTYITSINLKITKNSESSKIFSLLIKENEQVLDIKKTSTQGRPKGRMSKSKFDMYRLKIIDFLEKKHSVNEISKILKVSRSSLKDYINSRGLKDLVEIKNKLLENKDFKIYKKDASTECNIIKKEGSSHGLRH